MTYGDPERPLFWSSKSHRKLAEELKKFDIDVSYHVIGYLLEELGYSRKVNKKKKHVGKVHPDTEKQMQNILDKVKECREKGFIVISVDCKKKEVVGNFRNGKGDYCKIPIAVSDYDFKGKNNPTVVPYGIYDEQKNKGFINLGVSKDTSEFAVNSIEKWWCEIGCKDYPDVTTIFITCDGGGSNSRRSIRFKLALQKFADKYDMTVIVAHFPPGKAKFNKIEHRLFCLISNNWRGRPLESIETVLNLIRHTTSTTGLRVYASLDETVYETKIDTNQDMLRRTLVVFDDDLPLWNYTIYPESMREEVQHIVDKQWEMIDENEKMKRREKKAKKKAA